MYNKGISKPAYRQIHINISLLKFLRREHIKKKKKKYQPEKNEVNMMANIADSQRLSHFPIIADFLLLS